MKTFFSIKHPKFKRKILFFLFFLPSFVLSEEFAFICNGKETKYIKGDHNSKRATFKAIGIQIFEVGMRLDGEWFDNNNDLTEDYRLERSYLNTNNKIIAQRKFSTSALIENNKIKTIKIDKVEVNFSSNNILWEHEFNRINITENKKEVIYAFKKTFEGICKKK